MKCVDNVRNTKAKAGFWMVSDTEARRLGEQMGLDTPVVLAVNGARLVWGVDAFRAVANAISVPPGKYGRKTKTQRN